MALLKKHTRKLALLGAAVAVCLMPAGALAAPVSVTVRVEGAKQELVDRTVQVRSGTFTRSGHSCPEQSGAGALNLATGGRWSGSWSQSYATFSVVSIFGESYPFTQTKRYWELFVDGVPASTGLCGIKLRRAEQLLFAAVPESGTVYPLLATGPSVARVSQKVTLKVFAYDAKGGLHRTHPTSVTGSAGSVTITAQGTVIVRFGRPGVKTLFIGEPGHIRAPIRIVVSK